LQPKHIEDFITRLQTQNPGIFQARIVDYSVQKHPIYLISLGNGKTRVLLWSQMHGDEPTATAALFDVYNYLLVNRDQPFVRTILDSLIIMAIPMLNPDGAEQYARRNSQGLDINRDARAQQTPEGKILYQVLQQYHPVFAFNLHDQSGRRTVGKSNKIVALSLMAPPFEVQDNDNPARIRAKKIVSVIYQSLPAELYRHISKYDADYMPCAFGDAIQGWGTSTVLIESGGWYSDRDNFLQKLNFIVLVSAFHAIANQSYEEANPAIYDALPQNDQELFDLLLTDATIIDGTGAPPYRADVAINYNTSDPRDSLQIPTGEIVDLGDLDFFTAKEIIPANNFWLLPGLSFLFSKPLAPNVATIRQLQELLSYGYTTFFMPFQDFELFQAQALRELIAANNFSGNIAGLLDHQSVKVDAYDSLAIVQALGMGFRGLLFNNSIPEFQTLAGLLKLPVYYRQQQPQLIKLSAYQPTKIIELNALLARQWQLARRGKIRIGQIADLVLLAPTSKDRMIVHTVFIKGYPVWRQGQWLTTSISGEIGLPIKK